MNRRNHISALLVILVIGSFSLSSDAQPPIHSSNSSHSDFIDITAYPNVKLDKRYACTNNFCREILDTNKYSCSLHPIAAEKFLKACQILAQEEPGWKFIVYDAFRPISVQRKLYEHVKGTPKAHYVAYPTYGIHCYGFAIDLSLVDNTGTPIDMGTEFDDFSELAEPRFEVKFMKAGKLTKEQYANRLLLRSVMKRAGFHQLQREWWHYEALPEHIVRARFKQLD
ncbi:MAG: M15 family metallopeptidase [Bacteroidota bacterium]|nr:M15 family metallopeptidase [Bacteroidota bacterium]